MLKSAKLLIMFAAVVLFAACDNKNEVNTQPPVSEKIETLLDIIDIDNGIPLQEITLGSPVRFVLELRNLTDETLTLNFSSSLQYDFEVHDSKNKLVWNWSHDKLFTQALTTIILDPNDQVKFTPEWDQKDNEGRQIPAGIYRVTGLIPTVGPEIVQKSVQKPDRRKIEFCRIKQLLAIFIQFNHELFERKTLNATKCPSIFLYSGVEIKRGVFPNYQLFVLVFSSSVIPDFIDCFCRFLLAARRYDSPFISRIWT